MRTNNINPGSIRWVFLLLILPLISCEVDDFQKLEQRNWQLVWSDEFEGIAGTLPDPNKWTYDLGRGQDGWGNQELQVYTSSPENVSVDGNGNLVITAINRGGAFTSARIKTEGLFAQQYGRFEARMKTPFGPGLWPAFWMLGDNFSQLGWPLCGEIDIMELRGQEPNIVHGSIHGPGYSGGNAVTKAFRLASGRFDSKYHIFAIEWDQDKIDFFVDDFLYNRIERRDVGNNPWVFDQPFFMILNVAVGGTFVGFPTNQTPFPQRMIVDYVRVYRESN